MKDNMEKIMKHIMVVRTRILFSVVGLLMSAVLASPAAVISTFTDRATFNGAVGPTSVEDFNSFGSEVPFHTVPLDAGPFTLSMSGSPATSRNFKSIRVRSQDSSYLS